MIQCNSGAVTVVVVAELSSFSRSHVQFPRSVWAFGSRRGKKRDRAGHAAMAWFWRRRSCSPPLRSSGALVPQTCFTGQGRSWLDKPGRPDLRGVAFLMPQTGKQPPQSHIYVPHHPIPSSVFCDFLFASSIQVASRSILLLRPVLFAFKVIRGITSPEGSEFPSRTDIVVRRRKKKKR